jgi:hypothetical protein
MVIVENSMSSDGAIAFWSCSPFDGRLTFENYLTRRVVSADLLAAVILGLFDDWRAPAEVIAELSERTGATNRRRSL